MDSYDRIIDEVENLPFMEGREMAGAATKAVLGILTSRLDEDAAQRFTDALPDPLTYELLRSHQRHTLDISMDDTVAEISNQFMLNDMQSRELIHTVLSATRDAVGGGILDEIEQVLPADWAEVLHTA